MILILDQIVPSDAPNSVITAFKNGSTFIHIVGKPIIGIAMIFKTIGKNGHGLDGVVIAGEQEIRLALDHYALGAIQGRLQLKFP